MVFIDNNFYGYFQSNLEIAYKINYLYILYINIECSAVFRLHILKKSFENSTFCKYEQLQTFFWHTNPFCIKIVLKMFYTLDTKRIFKNQVFTMPRLVQIETCFLG